MFGGTNDNIEEIKKLDAKEVAGIKLFLGSSTGKMLIDNHDSIQNIFNSTRHYLYQFIVRMNKQ